MKQKKLSIYTFIGARKQGFILSVILSLLGVAAEMVPYFVGVRVICMMYEGQSDLHAYVLPLGIAVAAYIVRCSRRSRHGHRIRRHLTYSMRFAARSSKR